MIPDTVSAFELARALVALFGLRVSWRGRLAVRRSLAEIPDDGSADVHERSSLEQRRKRMALFEVAQSTFLLIHAGLLANALISMAYANAPVEQANVMSNNLVQMLIPIALARVSERITLDMSDVSSLRGVAGPRTSEVVP